MKTKTIFAMATVLTLVAMAQATTFYVDPVNGSLAGDGSQSNPWRMLQDLFDNNLIESYGLNSTPKNTGAPVKGGDTILLLSGFHGEVNDQWYFNDDVITIEAAPGHEPQLSRIYFWGGSRWTFRNLTISPSLAPVFEKVSCVQFMSRFGAGTSMYNTIEDCFLYSSLDTSNWTANDWVTKACTGIFFEQDGRFNTARNNHMFNVAHGVVGQSEDSLIEYNVIENFSLDGIRATGCGTVYQYNLIKNCYNVDDNHDDGIQGFYANNPGTVVIDDVVLRGNTIINHTDPNQPHQGPLQGIGCFDGPFRYWLVENNLLLNNHWHGITLYEAEGCDVINNTVFNKWYYDGVTNYETWIDIVPGDYYTNVVRNNIAHRIRTYTTRFVADHNLIVHRSDPADEWFVDYANFDLRLTELCPAVDAGSLDGAPEFDAAGNVRPYGYGMDIGAHEYGSYPPVVADAGADVVLTDTNGDGVEMQILSASASFSITAPIISYVWYENGQQVWNGQTALLTHSVGVHTYTLTVTNNLGQKGYDEVVVTVESAGSKPGDANDDGSVNLDDFIILKQNYGISGGATWSQGDFTADGNVNLDDFIILKQNYGT